MVVWIDSGRAGAGSIRARRRIHGRGGRRCAQVVGGEIAQFEVPGVLAHDPPDRIGGEGFVGNPATFADGAQQRSDRDAAHRKPGVDEQFDPSRQRHGAEAVALAHQIRKQPTPGALLDVFDLKPHQFGTAQGTPSSKPSTARSRTAFIERNISTRRSLNHELIGRPRFVLLHIAQALLDRLLKTRTSLTAEKPFQVGARASRV
jgi:hypothetical protein